ncbi:MAG: sugar porter family MFS transporter [Candidatus Margulisiibacteriota bacterium]
MSGEPSGSKFVYLAAAISALGGMLFGYDTGVISSAILFLKDYFSLSPTLEEIVVAIALVGAVIGAAFGGRLSDRFGRRKVIIACAFIFVAGALFGSSMARTVTWLFCGRIIIGIAIGATSFAAPLYISEVSPVNIRGKLVGFNQLAVTIGIVISYLVGYALAQVTGGWRGMFAFAAIPASLLGIGMLFMPDSPRWLLSHGSTDKARKVLERIRGTAAVEQEINEIQESLKQQSGHWKELLSPLVRPALIVGIGLAVLQQVTGINTVIYYAPTIFEFAGFQSAASAILATVGVGIINVLLTIVALRLVDRVGRRPLLLIGLAGMTLSLIVLGVAFNLPAQSGLVGWISAIGLMFYVGSFAVGMGPVFWLLIAEIYPLMIRGMAMSTAAMFNWGSNLIIGITFLTLIQLLGRSGTFWLYGLLGIMAWLFVYFLVPETKGRSLEEIESHWRAGKHPREMGKS